MKKMILVIMLMMMFSGCGPQYKTFTTYTPPADIAGKDCVQRCYLDKIECEKEAWQNNQICRKEAQISAKEDYLHAKEDYLHRYEAWIRMSKKCEQKHPPEGCKHVYDNKPKEPALSDFTGHYICPDDTGKCIDNYETCFEMCGGQIYRETRCVSNCK